MIGRFLCWLGYHKAPKRHRIVFVCQRPDCWQLCNRPRLP